MDNTFMIIIAISILLLILGVIGVMMSKKSDKEEKKEEAPTSSPTPITPPATPPTAATTKDLTVFANVLSNSPKIVNLSGTKNIGIIDGHTIEMHPEPYPSQDFSLSSNGIPCNAYNNELICSGSSKPMKIMTFAFTPRNSKDLSAVGKFGGDKTCVNEGQKITCNGAPMNEFPTKPNELYRIVYDCPPSGCTGKIKIQSGSNGKYCILNNDKTISCTADSISQGQAFEGDI